MVDEKPNPSEGDASGTSGKARRPAKTTVLDLRTPGSRDPSDRPPSHPPKARRSYYGRWILAVAFGLTALACVVRLLMVERQTREPIDLTYMIADGETSTAMILGSDVEPPLPELETITWYAVRTLPALTRLDDGTIQLADDPGIAELTGGLSVGRVNGVTVDAPQLDELLEANPRDRRRWITLANGEEFAFLRVMHGIQWARLLAGLSVGALGVLAYCLRPGSKSSVGFLVACLYVAALWYTRSVPFYSRMFFEDLAYHLLTVYLAVPYAVFMAAFTPLRLVIPRPLYAGLAAAVPSTAIFFTNWALNPNATYHGFLIPPLFTLWAFYMMVMIVLTVPFGLWCRVRRVSMPPTDRSRGRVIGIAVLISFAPLTLLTFFDFATDYVMTPRFLAEVAVVLFPIVVTYAIVRHNLLRVSELVREGLTYSLLSIGLLLVYAGVTAGASALLSAIGEGYIQGLAVAGTVLVAIPTHNALRRTMAKRLEVPPEEYDDLLHRLDEIAKEAPSPDGYCRDVVRLLERVAKTDRVSILVREPGDIDWKISDSQHGSGLTPVMHAYAPLIDELEGTNSEVFLDDYLDELGVSQDGDTPLASLRALEANAVLPLSARNQVIGALALGARLDQRNHSARELKLYKRLGAHIAGALVHMFDRLRTASGDRIVDIYPLWPDRIGSYVIQRALGEGGMSYVYLGENSRGPAAIKVCNRFVQSDRKLLERFHREGTAMKRIKHPNIVPILDVGWEGPEPYIALEYFPRGSLDDVIQEAGPASEAEAMRYLKGAIRGLEAALRDEIIHRDIKPTNLFVTDDGEIKIGDFGLARLADQTTLTREGEMFGTPHFMAPEILQGEAADWTADQYALGITIYYALTKRLPFDAETVDSVHYQQINVPMPDIRAEKPGISQPCSDLLDRMTAKKKDQRFGSYAEIERAVESILRALRVR